jgi:hypothetical protein
MTRFLTKTRYLILIPILGLAVAAATFFIFGALVEQDYPGSRYFPGRLGSDLCRKTRGPGRLGKQETMMFQKADG